MATVEGTLPVGIASDGGERYFRPAAVLPAASPCTMLASGRLTVIMAEIARDRNVFLSGS